MERWKTFRTTSPRCGKKGAFTREWQISDHGNIRWYNPIGNSYNYRKTFETGGAKKSRYLCISINDASEKYVHRLVAANFVDNPHNYDIVNHIDGNKLNNHYTNLEWTTYRGNLLHAYMTNGKLDPKVYMERRRVQFQTKMESELRECRIEMHRMLHGSGYSVQKISELSGFARSIIYKDITK